MKLILGKVFFIVLFTVTIFANVNVSVEPPLIYRGGVVNFIISADGDNIEFPDIKEIAGYPIIGTSSSHSINVINGNITKNISKTYSFKPDKNITIPPFNIKVDNKIYKTKKLNIKVLEPKASRDGEPFVLEMRVDKRDVYIGEDIDLSVIFKRKIDARIDKLEVGEPKVEDFWVKKIDGVEKTSEKDYIVEKIHYKLFPQKAGTFTIPKMTALIGVVEADSFGGGVFNDPFFNSFVSNINWKKIYSDSLTINVKPLPNGLELYGDFKISASVDKRKVYANKPVNLTIKVEGEGNIDDIKKFELNLNSAVIYSDEPKIKSKLINGKYHGEFTQKIAIIADNNFTIPPFKLKYFDKKSKKVKEISTKPIDIEVIGGGTTATQSRIGEVKPFKFKNSLVEPIPQKVVTEIEENKNLKYLYILMGFIAGVLFTLGVFKVKVKLKTKREERDIIKAIKKAKSDKELFNLLLPYAKRSSKVKEALDKLEKNIYQGEKNKIDKQELIWEMGESE